MTNGRAARKLQTVRCVAVIKVPRDWSPKDVTEAIRTDAKIPHAKSVWSRVGRRDRVVVAEVSMEKVGASTYHVDKALRKVFNDSLLDVSLIDITRDGEVL